MSLAIKASVAAAASLLSWVIGCSDHSREFGDAGNDVPAGGARGGSGGAAGAANEAGSSSGTGNQGGSGGTDAGAGGNDRGGSAGSGGDAGGGSGNQAGDGGTGAGGGGGSTDGGGGSAGDAGSGGSCSPESATECVGSKLYWVDSCGVQGALKSACASGCAEAACNTMCDAAALMVAQTAPGDTVLIPPWQSFTSTVTGELRALEIRLNAFGGISGELRVYLDEGIAGELLHAQPYSFPSESDLQWKTFTLTTPVPMQVGQRYTWELTGSSGIEYSETDTYAGGRASDPRFDMVFRAIAAPCH